MKYIAPMNGGVILSSFLGHKGPPGHTEIPMGGTPFVSRSDKKMPSFMGAV